MTGWGLLGGRGFRGAWRRGRAGTAGRTVAAVTAVTARTATLAGGAVVLLLVDPAFDADQAVKGAGFRKAVVERHAQGLERHLALAVTLGAGDVRATKAAGDAQADAVGTELHGGLDGALHGAAERNAALELDGHLLGDELGIEFRLADFEDVELDLGAVAKLGNLIGHDLDLTALAADDEAGA